MCLNEAYNTLLFMQIAILLHDLQLHLIIINVYTGTILKLYIAYYKDVHLNREEKSALQMITCTNSIHNLQGFHQNIYSLITLLSIVTNCLFVLNYFI